MYVNPAGRQLVGLPAVGSIPEKAGAYLTERGRQERLDKIPAGRPGHPDEIAAAVAYLTSPEAGYVNGEVHHVNGGWVLGR